MGKRKPGQVRHQVTLDERSEISEDLVAYAQKRRLKSGQANLCILADWSDAMRGRPNPFGVALASVQGAVPLHLDANQVTSEQEETPEQRKRREEELAASSQFM